METQPKVLLFLAPCWHRFGTMLADNWNKVDTILHHFGTKLADYWNKVDTMLHHVGTQLAAIPTV